MPDDQPDVQRGSLEALIFKRIQQLTQQKLKCGEVKFLVCMAQVWLDTPSRSISATQDELAAWMGENRTCVQRALYLLAARGLVTVPAGTGGRKQYSFPVFDELESCVKLTQVRPEAAAQVASETPKAASKASSFGQAAAQLSVENPKAASKMSSFLDGLGNAPRARVDSNDFRFTIFDRIERSSPETTNPQLAAEFADHLALTRSALTHQPEPLPDPKFVARFLAIDTPERLRTFLQWARERRQRPNQKPHGWGWFESVALEKLHKLTGKDRDDWRARQRKPVRSEDREFVANIQRQLTAGAKKL